MAKVSVIRGTGYLVFARVSGMAGGFVLFLLLSWRSPELAGHFRTATTYFVLLETLPLLGMHRWLATEMGRHAEQAWALFRRSNLFATGVAALGIAVLCLIAASAYGPEISALLRIVAVGAVPSAVYLCALSGLVGIGHSDESGALSGIETAVRSIICIALVLGGAGVATVMFVFVAVRWLAALTGFVLVRRHVGHGPSCIDPVLARAFVAELPTLSLAMIGFLVLRNAAMLLLPLLSNDAETGLYAAPFQLFDLLLLPPSLLIVSSNYSFVASAKRSASSLRRSTNELLSITALYAFPVAAIGCVLAAPIIVLLFGNRFAGSVLPFQLLVVAAAVLSLDQVFALALVTAGDYRADRAAIVGGGLTTLIATWILSRPEGAVGAAIGCLAGAAATLALRLHLMPSLFRRRTLGASLTPPALAAAAAAATTVLAAWSVHFMHGTFPPLQLLAAPVGAATYFGALHYLGGLSPRHVRRVRQFMTRPG